MLRIWLFAIVLGLTIAEETLTVNKIVKIDLNKAAPYQLGIHYTLKDNEFNNANPKYPKWHLNIWKTPSGGGKPEQHSIYATKMEDTYLEFEYDLKDGNADIEFILAGQNDKDVDQVTTDIKLKLPALPSDLDSVASWVGNNNDIALRVTSGITKDFTYEGKICKGDSPDTTCYYVDVTKDKKKALELCSSVKPTRVHTRVTAQGDINVCDQTQIVADDNDLFGTGKVPKEAEISYPKSGKADITIKRDSDDFELVVYKKSDGNIVQDSVTVCLAATCKVDHNNHDDTYIIMMVGMGSGVKAAVTDSTVHTLKDYDVVGTGLSNTLMETRWTRLDNENKYIVSTTGVADFTESTVTCENENNDPGYHCFAYFTGLTKNTQYPLSVKITDGTTPTKTNTVTLTGTKTNNDGEGMELNISRLDTKWHKGLRSFEVNTCIHQADTSELSTYEAILINKRGQWKKVYGATHRTGSELCFDALHVDIYNFDLSEDITLVVVKRGFDGVTVLETAHTDISVEGNQINAALRNSSSGTM